MISNAIDASGSNSQLLDLLTVVAKPELYAARIADLDAKTEEYRKMVEAVGPASEIVAMRDQAKLALEQAEAKLSSAKAEAALILSDAKAQAAETQRDARSKSAVALERASSKAEEAEKDRSEASLAAIAAKSLMEDAVKVKAGADAELEKAKADRSELAKATKNATDLREAIVEKHRAFIEGL